MTVGWGLPLATHTREVASLSFTTTGDDERKVIVGLTVIKTSNKKGK